MKSGIFVALAALALAVFAVPEAHGSNGRTLRGSFFGTNFITSSQADGTPTPIGESLTSMQSGIIKGSGGGIFAVQSVFEKFEDDTMNDCPSGLALKANFNGGGANTFNDGSMLSYVYGGPGSFCCTDQDFSFFVCQLVGFITGGEGRFEGETGTIQNTSRAEAFRIVGETIINLD